MLVGLGMERRSKEGRQAGVCVCVCMCVGRTLEKGREFVLTYIHTRKKKFVCVLHVCMYIMLVRDPPLRLPRNFGYLLLNFYCQDSFWLDDRPINKSLIHA